MTTPRTATGGLAVLVWVSGRCSALRLTHRPAVLRWPTHADDDSGDVTETVFVRRGTERDAVVLYEEDIAP